MPSGSCHLADIAYACSQSLDSTVTLMLPVLRCCRRGGGAAFSSACSPQHTCTNATTPIAVRKHAHQHVSRWPQPMVRMRPFSSARPLVVDSDDDGDGAGPSVQVIRGGETVLVRFPAGSTEAEGEAETTFDAAWLWSNCPSGVLPDSGQRTRSPGQFPGWKIASATILDAESALSVSANSEASSSGVLPIPPPPPGSAHPILGNNLFRGVVPQSSQSLPSSSAEQQKLLRVVWDTAANSRIDDDKDAADQNMYPSRSYFDVRWLQQWQCDELALARRRRRSEVTTAKSIPNINKYDTDSGLFEVDYNDIVTALEEESSSRNTDCGLFALLRSMFTDGASLVRNVPCIDGSGTSVSPVEVVGKAIGGGRLSHGALYGDIFHVKSIPSAHNIAYTSHDLAPHQDLAYYESPPGIQLLHCVGVSPTLVGGESLLIDCMAAAERLRHLAPDYFRTLATFPATFVKQRDGACMTYQRPHIVLKENAGGSSGGDCIDREIVSVNWSPPFEGPVCIGQDRVRSYYKAYAAFEYMVDNSLPMPPPPDHLLSREEIHRFASHARENTWEYQLQPGQMLVFNNKRMLHGRRGFADHKEGGSQEVEQREQGVGETKPIRHLVGAYTNIDDTLCRYRVNLQEMGKAADASASSIPNVGNGTTSSVP